WADRSRREPLTAAAGDLRQVVAQAWYPTDRTSGRTTRYVGAGGDTALMTDLPPGLFRRYDHTRVPAHDDVPVSPAQDRWPVLLFSPGLGMARQSYTALCTELASRGYVVVAISHPYESPVTVLADGHRAAPHRFDPSTPAGRAEVARLVDVRAADSSFVLSRLERLTTSPLAGHLDLAHVGILGHSLGGATAARAMALDHRFRAGADLDGRLFGAVPSLDRPFLWVQSEASTETRRELGPTHRTRDELLERLRGGGALVTLAGTTHLSFSDVSGYLTPVGRQLLGRLPAAGIGTAEAARTAATTADLVTGVLGPVLHAPPAHTLAQVAARDTTVRVERTVEAARQGKVSVTTVRRTR
ncbi:MAG: hypothetical protein HOQ22_04745, partial [Nocardioidaceae bacterium]|nr:hypothetical protein [Nocardioidaceae bacterium]